MKIAVMADIHSNIEAFKTCYEEAEKQGVTEYIFLGDYLGDMANPQETLCLLHEIQTKYPCTFVRGNKEEYWINHRKNTNEVWATGSTTTGMLNYNYERLSDKNIDFFENMPISKEMQYEGFSPFIVCHGSPDKVNQSMRSDYDYINQIVKDLKVNLIICGHFHIQTQYERKGILIVNPGAVGVPLHSGGKTQFMILHGADGIWKQEFFSLPYDVNVTLKSMEDEKLFVKAPGWYQITKHLLLTGETSHAEIVRHVRNQYFKDIGKCDLKDIPEWYWKQELIKIYGFLYQ